jgi:cobalt-precorrin-5B (C1)-methyltransferase
MTRSLPRRGYTLPVFACAAAIAAYRWLQQPDTIESVNVNLLTPAEVVEIPIEQVAGLCPGMALAVTKSDPGDNLDLTRNTPIWAMVEVMDREVGQSLVTILGGEGLGITAEGKAAIYSYATQLLQENLQSILAPDQRIVVTIVLPEGRKLAARTSNAAFGVTEGLSLLGTTGISQPLSSPDQLQVFQQELQAKAGNTPLVFCIGENGLDLVQKLGIPSNHVVKTANWLGSMLVTAAQADVQEILLFGYHGKLIKLAGGIFHTHHHLADGRLEIFVALAAKVGLPTPRLQQLYQCTTTDNALSLLRQWDESDRTHWVEQIYTAITQQIDQKATEYIHIHSEKQVVVGSVLFDRSRQIIIKSQQGADLLSHLRQI